MSQLNSDFHKYYFENWQFVFKIARKILNNREAAEDITNDVFMTLYEYMQVSNPPIRKIRPWLAISVKRRAYNYLRDNKRLVPLSPELREENAPDNLENKLFAGDILNRLYHHNERWFDMMEKYYILEMSTREIAAEYGCSEQAVRNSLHRAKEFIRKEYDPAP